MATTQKPVIVIDFDGVLFDAEAFKVGLRDAVRPLGVSQTRWETAYQKRDAQGVIRIKELAENLADGVNRDPQDMLDAFATEVSDAPWYLYADARPFLQHFADRCDLYLLTFGDPTFQRQKVAACGIENVFTGTYYVDQPKHTFKALPVTTVDRAIFINDNIPEMLDLAGRYRWSHHLHVNRSGAELTNQTFASYPDLRNVAGAIEGLMNTEGTGVTSDTVSDQGGNPA